MAIYRTYDIKGINLKTSPFNEQGQVLSAVNVETDVIGAKKKRSGYVTYLGTPDANQVNTLFDWHNDTGTQFWNYRASGSILWYSQQGTGAWTVCGNGTIPNNDYVFSDVLENTLVITSPNGTTRHSTNGTSFTDTSLAPVSGVGVTEFQNRIWIPGTASSLFYSTTGTPTDWTSDSSSITIPGAGKLLSSFKNNNRLVATKNSGQIYRWDGVNLTDQSTNLGPTSYQSIDEVEGFRFYLNRLGVFGYGGMNPEIVSNPIEKYVYNDDNKGIVGTTFDNAPGAVHKYNYFVTIGSVTDDLVEATINPCTLVYDYQKDEWLTWKTADTPTAWHSFKDTNGDQQLIFGDGSGQCYQLSGTATSDNGKAITASLEGVINFQKPENDKTFRKLFVFSNPGCQANFQVAVGDTFSRSRRDWTTIGDLNDGFVEYHFPANSQGKLLFYRISESSQNPGFHLYGMSVDFNYAPRR